MIHRNLFLICMIFCAGITAQAQLRPLIKAIDEVEVIAGPSLVSLRGNEWVEMGRKTKIGYMAGVGVKYELGKHFLFGPDFFFQKKGSKQVIDVQYYDATTNSIDVGEMEYITSFSYVAISPTLTYISGERVKFFLAGGAFLGCLLKEVTTSKASFRNNTNMSVGTEDFKRIDTGLTIRIGATTTLHHNLSLKAQFAIDRGLLNISELDPDMFTWDVVKTNAATLLIGINYKL